MRKNWTLEDHNKVINAYHFMLGCQLSDQKCIKNRVTRFLMDDLGRGKGGIECLLANISAVRDEKGLPTLKGYKPMSNYSKTMKQRLEYALANDIYDDDLITKLEDISL